jgi:hypothetical protein
MRPRDLRAYARTTTARLIAGGLLVVLVVGGALVYASYGPGAMFSALLCIGLGLAPIALVILALAGLDFVRRRMDRG